MRRCYNGCPDSGLKEEINSRIRAEQKLKQMGFRAVSFPMEGKWKVFDSGFRALSPFLNDVFECLSWAERNK